MVNDKATFRDNYAVPGCKSCAASPENYNFFLKSCRKLTGRNVTAKVKEIVAGSQEQAQALTNGDWVLCYSGRDEEEKVWLGRCVNNERDALFNQAVTWQNATGKVKKNVGVGKITLAREEVGVTIQWYDKCREQMDPSKCVQYKICDTVPPCVQSATSVISSKFKMTQMEGSEARSAYTRRQQDTTPGTVFLRPGVKVNKYMTTFATSMKRQMQETWELDMGTYIHAENAVDWFNSKWHNIIAIV